MLRAPELLFWVSQIAREAQEAHGLTVGQSVLEGLNALLDHRAEVFIPELGATFQCPPTFRIFAAQNPVQEGGGRRGLPKSFLNRFTRVHVELLDMHDLYFISGTSEHTSAAESGYTGPESAVDPTKRFICPGCAMLSSKTSRTPDTSEMQLVFCYRVAASCCAGQCAAAHDRILERAACGGQRVALVRRHGRSLGVQPARPAALVPACGGRHGRQAVWVHLLWPSLHIWTFWLHQVWLL